jgi:hypothetical protein
VLVALPACTFGGFFSLAYENEFNFWRNPEVEKVLDVEVTCLGKVLEGNGQISSSLEEGDYASFEHGLKQSIAQVEEADCAACIDGRCTNKLKSGEPGKIRPRKAAGSVSTFLMMGLGDRLFLDDLKDNNEGAEGLYATAGALQIYLDNRECGHEDCAAAKGAVKHLRSVAQFEPEGPTTNLIQDLVRADYGDVRTGELVLKSIGQASELADVLEQRGWNGDEYVDHVANDNPEAVEILFTKHDAVHGHAEQAVVLVDGPVDQDGRPLHTIDKDLLKKLTGLEVFVINLNELRRDANKLGKSEKQKAQLYTAALLHVAGAYKNLGDGSHPVFVVKIGA